MLTIALTASICGTESRVDFVRDREALFRDFLESPGGLPSPDISIRRKRKRSGWSDEFARTVLGQMR